MRAAEVITGTDSPDMPESIQIGPGCYVRERRGWYRIRFYDSSRRPRHREFSLNTQGLPIAMERAREHYRKYELGIFDPWETAIRDTSIADAVSLYKRMRRGEVRDVSLEDVVWHAERFASMFPRVTLGGIREHHVRDFVYQIGIKPKTKLNYYSKLNVFLNWCVEQRLIDRNPADGIDRPTKPRPIPKYFTEAQLDRLIEGVRQHWIENRKYIHQAFENPLWAADVYDLAASSGLRRNECERLRWGDVVWPEGGEPGYLVIRSDETKLTKNADDDTVTMIPRAERRLRYLLELRRTDDPLEPVLKNISGREAISGEYASKRFSVYCRAAGLPDITFHGLRHTFAAMCRMKGMELYQLKEEMRHRDIQSTMIYGHIGPAERRRSTYALFTEKDV